MSAAFALLIFGGVAAIWAIAWAALRAYTTKSYHKNKELKADRDRYHRQLMLARQELRLASEGHGTPLSAQIAIEEINRLEIES